MGTPARKAKTIIQVSIVFIVLIFLVAIIVFAFTATDTNSSQNNYGSEEPSMAVHILSNGDITVPIGQTSTALIERNGDTYIP